MWSSRVRVFSIPSLIFPFKRHNFKKKSINTIFALKKLGMPRVICKIGISKWDFYTCYQQWADITMMLLTNQAKNVFAREVLYILLTEYFSSGEYLSHRYCLVLLKCLEIWVCKCLFFFSFRWREYAFKDSKQVSSRKRNRTHISSACKMY